MDEFENRAQTASTALRREAASIADTERALEHVMAPPAAPTALARRATTTRRRATYVALVISSAAAAVGGLVWVAADDDPTRIGPAVAPTAPATVSPSIEVPVPSPSSVTTRPTTSPSSVPANATETSSPPVTPESGNPTGWVPSQPSAPAPFDPAQQPHLIVLAVADSSTRYRRDDDTPPRSEGAYVQAFATPDGSGVLSVQTDVGSPGEVTGTPRPTIGPWQVVEGISPLGGPQLVLVSGEIRVALDTDVLTVDDLELVAAGIAPRGDGSAGWTFTTLPDEFVVVGDAPWWTWSGRTDVLVGPGSDLPASQLNMTVGVPGAGIFPLATPLRDGEAIVNFNGRPARYELRALDAPGTGGAVSRLFWEYAPSVFAELYVTGSLTPEEMMQTVRTQVEEVDAARWAQTAPLPSGDGCPPVYDC